MIYHSKGVTVSPKGQVATINLAETTHVLIIDSRVKKVRFVGKGKLIALNVEKTDIKEIDLTEVDVSVVVYVPYGTTIKELSDSIVATNLDPIPSYQTPVIPKEMVATECPILDYNSLEVTLEVSKTSMSHMGDTPTTESISNRPGLSIMGEPTIALSLAEDSLLRKFLTLGVLNQLIPTNKLNRVNLEAFLFNLVEVGEENYQYVNEVGADLVMATNVPPVKLGMYVAALNTLTPYNPWTISSILTSAINKHLGIKGLF